MPTVDALVTHPVKSLDPLLVDEVDLVGGRLRHDREYALQDDDRELVKATGEPALHRVRSSYDPETRTLTARRNDEAADAAVSFALDSERGDANAWFSDYLGYPVALVRDAGGGFMDREYAKGPSIVSTGTLEAIGEWFDLDPANVRRRIRANVVVDAEPFWEDRLWTGGDEVVAFRIGDVEFEGVGCCARCVVPSRDPDTGEAIEGFQRRFVERREATMPAWADADALEHYYQVMALSRVHESADGGTLAVGDEVEVFGTRPRDAASAAD
ncbi:MOSC domain-containing protein [Halorubellus sp. JP-L1]|uniref:MOSC domain-containing protein n=1 Tax=Halorubellus sp. JP-L1 TaxID=2715753 RepID=UPI00140E6B92|nr:MOSC N-terminal beta barrel domain-containing protein [Halorubellus sp. JP-L1]NHN43074.1 MOSC domain-containing protein [Halorubellus sp. JP-L1]